MLAIRLQRTGRSGHAQFRVIVQDSRFSPTSGWVVAYVGSYDPHTKAATLDVDKIKSYLDSGAQPSPRVVSLLKADKVKLPDWVATPGKKQSAVRNPDKRRSTRPEAPAEEAAPEAEVAEPAAEPNSEAPATEAPAVEAPVEAPVEENAEPQATEEPTSEEVAEPTEPVAEEAPEAEPSSDEATEPVVEAPAEAKE